MSDEKGDAPIVGDEVRHALRQQGCLPHLSDPLHGLQRERRGWTSDITANTCPVIMYGSAHHPLQQIPDMEQHSPYNHFGKRKRDAKRIMIYIHRDVTRQKQRMQISEHPFGTIKHTDNAGNFLCRGKEKVTAEYVLSSLSYNIRRTITICGGVPARTERFKGITLPKIQKIA